MKKNVVKWLFQFRGGGGAKQPESVYPRWDGAPKPLPLLAQSFRTPTLEVLPHSQSLFVTLSGHIASKPTLNGTEMCQKGTLAILSYAYCHQWQ